MASEPSTPKPVRRRSNGIRTRAEIVAAAERHFSEHGYEATRLEDIAAAVGIRRAAIFYHFGDKQELYAAVHEEVFRDWTEALPVGGSAPERLEASLTAWIDFVAQRPSVARLILREVANARPGKVSTFEHASVAAAWIRAVIDEGIASGELEPLIEPHRFLSLMGAITIFHFAAMPWLTIDGAVDPWSGAELDKHKREILLVARGVLGIREKPAADETRNAETRNR